MTSPFPDLCWNFLHLAMNCNDPWARLTLHWSRPTEMSMQGGHRVGAPQTGAGGVCCLGGQGIIARLAEPDPCTKSESTDKENESRAQEKHVGLSSPRRPSTTPLFESQAEENKRDLTPIIPGRDDLIDIFQPSCLLSPNKMTCASKQLLSCYEHYN